MNKRKKDAYLSKSKRVAKRLHLLLFFSMCAFSVLIFRLWTIQIYQHEAFKERAKYNYVRDIPIKSERGWILDRDGRVLAHDIKFYDLWLPIKVEGGKRAVTQEIQTTLALLSEILETDYSKLERVYLTSERDWYYKHARVRIASHVPWDRYVAVLGRNLEFPEEAHVFPEEVSMRYYPKQDLAAHALGRTAEIDKDELKLEKYADYRRGDWVGKTGIEKQYESFLRGKDGVMEVTVDRHEIQRGEPRIVEKALPGHNLVLTIDYDLQKAAEEALGASRGVIIITDPKDNAVLAMATNPRYNPNFYRRDYGKNYFNPDKPLYDRAIKGGYPPGSVIKVFETFALCEEMGMEPGHTEYCSGMFVYKGFNKPWNCHKKGGHGQVTLTDAICLSCNVFYYRTIDALGINRLFLWMDRFGFNNKTGIDLPDERYTAYPTPRTKHPWYAGDTINLAIGQGDLLLTPIQVAMAAGALANGGTLYRPHVMEKILAPGERSVDGEAVQVFEPQKIGEPVEASVKTWNTVLNGMWEVVHNPRGTGRRVKNDAFALVGKTGTAQNPGQDHAWFICFGPYEKPEIVFTLLIENSGHGGEVASPMVNDLLKVYLDNKPILAQSAPVAQE